MIAISTAAFQTVMADLIIRTTLVLLLAWAAARALAHARGPATLRHLAWQFGLSALLFLPLLATFAPILRVPILPPLPVADSLKSAMSGAGPTHSQSHGGVSPILILYAAGVAVLISRLAFGYWRITRLWRAAAPVADQCWVALLSDASRKMGLLREPELRLAPGPAMPMTWGNFSPRILLPAEAKQWSVVRIRLVLLHELAHAIRRDSFGRLISAVVCALYWFHPGVWLATRQLRLEQEKAADDRVLRAGGEAEPYARNLLELAWGPRSSVPFHAAAMAARSDLELRLSSILSTSDRRAASPAVALAVASTMLGATFLIGAAVPVRIATLEHQPAGLPAPPGLGSGRGSREASNQPQGTATRNATVAMTSAEDFSPGSTSPVSGDRAGQTVEAADRPALGIRSVGEDISEAQPATPSSTRPASPTIAPAAPVVPPPVVVRPPPVVPPAPPVAVPQLLPPAPPLPLGQRDRAS